MGRTGHRTYRAKRAKLQRDNDTCWLCGGPIHPDHKYPHPLSFSADHVTPVSKGGHNLGELKPAHLKCNQGRGNRVAQQPKKHLDDW